MSSTTFHPVSSDKAFLVEGVKGVKCIDTGSREAVKPSLTTEQVLALARMDTILEMSVGIRMGTIEVYKNGALNVCLKDPEGVIGYVTYRP